MTKWITFPDSAVEVCGLPWFKENCPDLWRFPKSALNSIPERVAGMAKASSGARLRFATNSTSLKLKIKVTEFFKGNSRNNSLDLYADGRYLKNVIINDDGESVLTLHEGDVPISRTLDVYLPIAQELQVLAVGIDENSVLTPPQRAFRIDRSLVYYGSSVAQGYSTGRPGMSYQAILGRRLNCDYVNLGFSGSGKGEPGVMELVADVPGAAFVIDVGKSFRRQESSHYASMLKIIRAKNPATPILCLTPIFSTKEDYDSDYRDLSCYIREITAEAVESLNDRKIVCIDGVKLLGPDDIDGLQDQVHPNDLGSERIAERLEPIIMKLLK